MPRQKKERVGFLHAIFGLLIEPSNTTYLLYDRHEKPPYAYTLIVGLLLTYLVPIFAQLYLYNTTSFRMDKVLSLLIIFLVTFCLFVITEWCLLFMLRINASIDDVVAAIGYSLAPLTLSTWLLFSFNYMNSGSLTFIQYILTGEGKHTDSFIRIVPLAYIISEIWILLVFFYSMRALAGLSHVTALLITMFSLLPFALSVWGGLSIAESIYPGALDNFKTVLTQPSSLLVGR